LFFNCHPLLPPCYVNVSGCLVSNYFEKFCLNPKALVH
jgi:hypothetical protein